jgi:predicted RND superfamily exporter protein
MFNRILNFFTWLYKKPLAVSLCGIFITAFFAAAIPFVKFDNDIKNFLSVKHPHRLALEKHDATFGSSEIIIIGVESDNAYSKETVEYVKWLKTEIEKLNWGFPAQSISKELGLTIEESGRLIEAVNRKELLGKDALKEFLSSPEKMSAEMFWDSGFSEKIAGKMSRTSADWLLLLYRFPVDEIKSMVDTDFIRGQGDRFVVEKLIEPERIDDQSIQDMRGKVKSWNIYDKLLFSGDGRLSAMSVHMNPIDINLRLQFNIALEKIIRDNPVKNLKIYVAGEPVVMDRISSSMGSDLQKLLPFVLVVMLIILMLIFRHYEGVVFPMTAMIFSVIWSVGTMTLLDIPMNLVTISVPTVLTAVSSAYGIHFMMHYFMSKDNTRLGSSIDSMKVSGIGIIMAALTTVAGFGSLAISDMTHIRNYGIITAIGVFYSLIISVTLIPAFLLLRKSEKPSLRFVESETGGNDISTRFLDFVRNHPGRHPCIVFFITMILVLASIFGIRYLELNMNTMDFFQPGSDIKVADEHLNRQLAGTQILDINIETTDGSEVITPAILEKIERFQKDITEKFDIVGKTLSVNDSLKKMNQEMHGGNAGYYRLPDTIEMSREYLLLYSGNLKGVISKNRDRARIHISIRRDTTARLTAVRDYAASYFDGKFRKENKITVEPSGFLDLMVETNILILKGQISSLISSIILVIILIYLVFRNLQLTAVALIPLILGIIMNFGLMGFMDIPLNAATALVASISIGMGIDYSIHFISQFRNSLIDSPDIEEALRRTYHGTGRAILSNAASVAAGFMVLMFSNFPVIRQCGGLIAFTVTVTGIGAIIIIPAALKLIDRLRNNTVS